MTCLDSCLPPTALTHQGDHTWDPASVEKCCALYFFGAQVGLPENFPLCGDPDAASLAGAPNLCRGECVQVAVPSFCIAHLLSNLPHTKLLLCVVSDDSLYCILSKALLTHHASLTDIGVAFPRLPSSTLSLSFPLAFLCAVFFLQALWLSPHLALVFSHFVETYSAVRSFGPKHRLYFLISSKNQCDSKK